MRILQRLGTTVAVSLLLIGVLIAIPFHSSVFAGAPTQLNITGYAHYTFNNLHNPTGLSIANNVLYISDTGNNQIKKFDMNFGGPLQTMAGTGKAGYVDAVNSNAQFSSPTGIYATYNFQNIQTCGGCPPERLRIIDILINDSGNNAVRRLCLQVDADQIPCPTGNGNVVTVGGNGSSAYADGSNSQSRFSTPTGYSFAGTYIADSGNNTIRSFSSSLSSSSTTTSSVFTPQAPGYADGPRANARFVYPSMALQVPAGTLIVDSGNHAMRLLSSSGMVTTLAGNGTPGYADGTGTQVRFNKPTAAIYNASNNVTYIADTFNNCIRAMDSSGHVTTIAGFGGHVGLTDGIGTAARFDKPTGLAIGNGYLYVADSGNNAIRRINLSSNQVSTFIS